jgi:hypothetical protein
MAKSQLQGGECGSEAPTHHADIVSNQSLETDVSGAGNGV